MKKINALLASMIAVFAIGLSSCVAENEDDSDFDGYIVDFSPVVFIINVTDEDGHNLLTNCSPEFYESFSISYDGQKYKPEILDFDTRAYLPTFMGMRYVTGNDHENYLYFGEFNGSHCGVDFSFTMPDGEEHDISLQRVATSKGRDIIVDQTLKIDNKVIPEYTNGTPNILLTFTYKQ